jgi:hypothetical protein
MNSDYTIDVHVADTVCLMRVITSIPQPLLVICIEFQKVHCFTIKKNRSQIQQKSEKIKIGFNGPKILSAYCFEQSARTVWVYRNRSQCFFRF